MDFDFNKGKDKLKNIYEGAIVFGKKLMKKSWFKYALVMFFILMILLGFSLGTISANRSYAISKLEMALRKGSARDVAKLVQVDNKKMKLSSDEVTPMLQYYREDQSRITDLINILKDDKGAYGLSIKHRKHWYGQEYYVVLELKDIAVKSNFQDSKVYLNDKYVGVIDKNGVLKL